MNTVTASIAASAAANTAASSPRDRLLNTAADLFYAHGIHAVGVDRIVSEAGITRATFYRHFPSKEHLVVAYLELADAYIRHAIAQAQGQGLPPQALLAAVMEGLKQDVSRRLTRGCPFINAAAEYPAPEHPVRQAITAHRHWLRSTLQALLSDAGHPEPVLAAGQLMLLRDAALVGGYLDGWPQVETAFAAAAGQAVAPALQPAPSSAKARARTAARKPATD